MIYEEERTVDEMVNDILGDDPVRDGETPSAGGAQVPKAAAGAEPSRRVYELICKDCGAKFGSEGPATRYCPACRKKRISAGTRKKAEPAAPEDPVQKAWAELDEKATDAGRAARKAIEAERNAALEPPDPEDMEMDELLRTAADAMRRDTGNMILALYETIREVAKASGRQPGGIIQTLYELDCILERAERRSEA